MQPDLLHAQASVDWAEAQLLMLRSRIETWLNENVHIAIVEQPENVPNNVVVARQQSPLPISFQVEAGAYINAIRSSLDILACTLAIRYCPELIDVAYFPIAYSAENFSRGNYKGNKFVKSLPAKERSFIEGLAPFQGGNNVLFALHLLDIVRKHQRLLGIEVRPNRYMVTGWGDVTRAFTPVANGWMPSGESEAVIGLLAKDVREQPRIKLSMQVSLSETEYLPRTEV